MINTGSGACCQLHAWKFNFLGVHWVGTLKDSSFSILYAVRSVNVTLNETEWKQNATNGNFLLLVFPNEMECKQVPEDSNSAESWSPQFKGVWTNFLHFGSLKMWLLPSSETYCSRVLASCEIIFCILAAWKCVLCPVEKPTVQENLALCVLILCIFMGR